MPKMHAYIYIKSYIIIYIMVLVHAGRFHSVKDENTGTNKYHDIGAS